MHHIVPCSGLTRFRPKVLPLFQPLLPSSNPPVFALSISRTWTIVQADLSCTKPLGEKTSGWSSSQFVQGSTSSCEIARGKWHTTAPEKMTIYELSYVRVRALIRPKYLHHLIPPPVANQDTTLIEVPSSSPPVLKGYLNKYTNVARGYGTRWFVLKAGVFSC
jgi:hypothetical protein